MCSSSCAGHSHFVPANGATVPANLPAIYWRPRGGFSTPDPSMVRLTTAADPDTALAFTATRTSNDWDYLLVPDAPLVAGTQYVLTDPNDCSFSSPVVPLSVTFTVGPEAPLPSTLGTLGVTDLPARTASLASAGGSCTLDAVIISSAVAVDFPTAPDAAAWRDVLHYQTYVDNQPWSPRASILDSVAPGASWEGRSFDRVYAVCRVDSGGSFPQDPQIKLTEGTHQVEIRATLPGTNLAVATTTRSVTLDCPDVLPPAGDAGLDAGAAETGDGGCCSTSTAHPGLAVGLALLVLVALARRRRRALR